MVNKSINLSKRNNRVYNKYFKVKGRNGTFSKWVNEMMDLNFILDPEEAIRQTMRGNTESIEKLEIEQEKLTKKLRLIIDKKTL